MHVLNTVFAYFGAGIAVTTFLQWLMRRDAARELRERGTLHNLDPELRTSEFIGCVIAWPAVAFLMITDAAIWLRERGAADYHRLKAWFDARDKRGGHHGD